MKTTLKVGQEVWVYDPPMCTSGVITASSNISGDLPFYHIKTKYGERVYTAHRTYAKPEDAERLIGRITDDIDTLENDAHEIAKIANENEEP
jgi:hypothetical protein